MRHLIIMYISFVCKHIVLNKSNCNRPQMHTSRLSTQFPLLRSFYIAFLPGQGYDFYDPQAIIASTNCKVTNEMICTHWADGSVPLSSQGSARNQNNTRSAGLCILLTSLSVHCYVKNERVKSFSHLNTFVFITKTTSSNNRESQQTQVLKLYLHHQSVLPKGRSFTTNSGTEIAVLQGMNRCCSFPLFPHPTL